MSPGRSTPGSARYVFGVQFRVEPTVAGLTLSPSTFDAALYHRADPPGRDGWLFFRDHLWHGELTDTEYFRDLTAEALAVPVTAISFRELQTDGAYLESLRSAVGAQLEAFNAASVDQALTKYLGSSIRVVPADELADG